MSKTLKLCSGCRDDYYNHCQPDGCWSYANAKVVQRQRVSTWQPPPYEWSPETRLSCYSPDGFSMLPRDDSRIVEPAAEPKPK